MELLPPTITSRALASATAVEGHIQVYAACDRGEKKIFEREVIILIQLIVVNQSFFAIIIYRRCKRFFIII